MGEIRAKVKLENLNDRVLAEAGHMAEEKIRIQEIEAVVDTGAVMVLLPQDLIDALGIKTIGKVVVLLANDQKIELAKAGPITLTVAGRTMNLDCLVGPPGSRL